VTAAVPGPPTRVELLNSAGASVRSWFENYIRTVDLFPAREGPADTLEPVLVIVRLINTGEVVDRRALWPQGSRWLQSYADNAPGDALPVAMVWNLAPSSNVIRSSSTSSAERTPQVHDPDLYDLVVTGSHWSPEAFKATIRLGSGTPLRTDQWRSREDFAQ
jgi:hypothetical protein